MKYIIYARKSTEDEAHQVLSIESQLAELREFAVKPACRQAGNAASLLAGEPQITGAFPRRLVRQLAERNSFELFSI